MAIAINASLSKKIQLPGHEYASQQVSITITGEVHDLARVSEEAARLLGLAEASVDEKLGLTKSQSTLQMSSPATSTSQPQASAAPKPVAYPSSGGRRAPNPSSAAQHRLLRLLCDRTPGAFDRILAENRVASIEGLSSRAASAVIDQLKAAAP